MFILPPSMEELERRLRARSTDADAVVQRRLAGARPEIARGGARYDHVLVNDDLDASYARLEVLVAEERARIAGRGDAVARALRADRPDLRRWMAG